MATVHVTFRAPTNIGGTSIYSRLPRAAETITSSATSAQTSITALNGEIATIVASGGAVHVLAGSNPTAAADTGDVLSDGMRLEIGFMRDLDKIAVKDV